MSKSTAQNTRPECSAKDFASDQTVKWCPGCGDYAILKGMQKTLAELGIPREDAVFVSGIGCSSRFPYYMNTYGFHTIHGRAPAVATGVKIANSGLSTWVISGDGDALAIGGNHFIHAIRRNANLNMILFNNEIYGLTKGQYSPTTKKGQRTKSSPHGTIEHPFVPGELAIGSGSCFYARVVDNDIKMLTKVLKEAAQFKGFSLVEVLQNCVIFNDKTHQDISDRKTKSENQLILEHGKPLLFGENGNKGIIINKDFLPEVVQIGENGVKEEDILVHDEGHPNPAIPLVLSRLSLPDFPVALGVLRKVQHEVYDEMLHQQIKEEKEQSEFKSLNDLFFSGNTFEIT